MKRLLLANDCITVLKKILGGGDFLQWKGKVFSEYIKYDALA